MRLKSFVISEGRGQDIKQEEAVDIIKNKCKKSLNYYLKHGKTLFRGTHDIGGSIYINPKTSVRKSRNTDNYYTLILDNDPRWKSFPKRSQSIICSTSKNKSRSYGNTYQVFSYDGSRYGVCPTTDIWDSFKETMGGFTNLDNMNKELNYIDKQCDTLLSHAKTYNDFIENLEEMSDIIMKIDDTDVIDDENKENIMFTPLYKRWVGITKKKVSFKDWVISLYDPKKNEIFVTTDIGKVFSTGVKWKEVWTDGESILIDDSYGKEIFK